MYNEDAKDWKEIAKRLAFGKLRSAANKFWDLDTSSREEISGGHISATAKKKLAKALNCDLKD